MSLREDADIIIKRSLEGVLPDRAVSKALEGRDFGCGKVYALAVGKAAWQMAKTASEVLGDGIIEGMVITKYDHVKGEIPHFICYEAGHPVPDDNSFKATRKALEMVKGLKPEDTVLFLLSGGGSALFEDPLIKGEEMADITSQMLASGADIKEINTIRKRLSAVKGGRFAALCQPAQVFTIVLSDIIGDPLDMIASGPAYPDSTTCREAIDIAKKYDIHMSLEALKLMDMETPKELLNVETVVTGSVRELCLEAAKACSELGYEPIILTDRLSCEAREAGAFLSAIAATHRSAPGSFGSSTSMAYIVGGETVVHLKGKGKGGRNQELALSAAEGIAGFWDTAIFSLGSDGTDGPTDAAGGYVDGDTKDRLSSLGIDIFDALKDNDAYHALKACDGLIITGATGTNVNDVAVLLLK